MKFEAYEIQLIYINASFQKLSYAFSAEKFDLNLLLKMLVNIGIGSDTWITHTEFM